MKRVKSFAKSLIIGGIDWLILIFLSSLPLLLNMGVRAFWGDSVAVNDYALLREGLFFSVMILCDTIRIAPQFRAHSHWFFEAVQKFVTASSIILLVFVSCYYMMLLSGGEFQQKPIENIASFESNTILVCVTVATANLLVQIALLMSGDDGTKKNGGTLAENDNVSV